MIRILELALGILSIALGYRLFVLRERLFANVASGALLALFGMALVASAARTVPRHTAGAGSSRPTRSLQSPVHRYPLTSRFS